MSRNDVQLHVVWDDTVNIRELLIGVFVGGLSGFLLYSVSLHLLSAQLAGENAGLVKAYALMGGVLGALAAAIAVGVVFKPKRILSEVDMDTSSDRIALLASYGVDPDEEAAALQAASPKVVREMTQLQIQDLFVQYSKTSRTAE